MSNTQPPKSNHEYYLMLAGAHSKAMRVSKTILNEIDDLVLMYVTGTLPPKEKKEYLVALARFNIYDRMIKDIWFVMKSAERNLPGMEQISNSVYIRFCELMHSHFSGLISYEVPISEEIEIVCSVVTAARMYDKHHRKESKKK